MNIVPGILATFGTEEQCLEWIGGPDSEERLVIGAGSTTEPDCGNEVMCMIPDPKFGIKTTAKREGDEWVINGQKAPFCSCASHKDSQFYIVIARTDLTKPQAEGLTRFLVPAGTPGLSVAVDNLTDKIGDRCLTNAEVNYNDVRVPKENILGEEGKALPFPPMIHAMGGGASGAMAVGLARAAFEYAVDYAKKRVTWGQPIIKHEAIATMLADMQMQLESARLLGLRAAWNADMHQAKGNFAYNTWNALSGVNASEMAIRVTQMAMSILGGHGITKDFPVEKWVRDAFIARPSGYDNIIQRLNIAAAL
jgi:alkylation response protein AidB-like acyl-CoA dehydrogenase